jgi:hypothetical protein
MKVTTVTLADRKHYAHPENNRTLCGHPGAVDPADGVADCGRCLQILQGVDTSRGHR